MFVKPTTSNFHYKPAFTFTNLKNSQTFKFRAPTTNFVSSQFNNSKRFYHERVIDHYENPRNVGSLDKLSQNVGTGLVGAPACGDVLKLQIEVVDGIIVDAKFKAFGCGSAIASSSLTTEMIKGLPLDKSLEIDNTMIAEHLSLPPVKKHCSMLAEDAIKAAVRDYKSKQAQNNQQQVQTQ